MTPDLKPFFGGTYFPKAQLMNIMRQLARAWRDDRPKVEEVSRNLHQHLQSTTNLSSGGGVVLDEALFRRAYRDDLERFDPVHGGFGQAPKFPPSMQLRLLLRIHARTGDAKALEMVLTTLDGMARGGMYDHLGGGFARYSTDEKWLVPHFEKMLYDNALLTLVYLEAWQLTHEETWARVARETLDYVLRDMTSPEGGFYSAEDADSEGVEGKFYVWTNRELEALLTPDELARFVEVYGVTEQGNFEHGRSATGANILSLQRGFPWNVKDEPLLRSAHRKLLEARGRRVHPLKDDKQLTAWNGLMIAAMARAHQALGDVRYLEAARRSAAFLQSHLDRDGRLLRRYRDGEARYDGTLDDYAYLIQGLIALYESDFDQAWLRWALELQARQDARFWDPERGGYFYTPANAPSLIVRTRDFTDNATPNANAVAALSLLQLYHLTYEPAFKRKAEGIFQGAGKLLQEYPGAFAQLMIAADFYLDRTREVAVVGDATSEETRRIVDAVRREFLPNRVLASAGVAAQNFLQILAEKPMQRGRTTVYVCEEGTCRYPTSELAEVMSQLRDRRMYTLTDGVGGRKGHPGR
jgi:hypothetical protein